MSRLPLIGVTTRSRQIGLQAFHTTGELHARAVATAAKGLPVLIPSLEDLFSPSDILDAPDGILFTGSPSNVEPFHHQGPASAPGTAHDPARDERSQGKAFALGVQCHPGGAVGSNPYYLASSRHLAMPAEQGQHNATPMRQTTPDC